MEERYERLDEWPLVIVDLGDEASNQRVNEEFFVLLHAALDRGGRFGLVVDKTKIDLEGELPRSEAEREGVRWLKTVRDEMAERCAGIAYVLTEEVLESDFLRRRRDSDQGQKVFGCPTEAFADHASARRWLTSEL